MLNKSCTINNALINMFGWKKFSQKYDFESKDTHSHIDATEANEPSFEEVLIEKTESASINHSNVNFLKVKVTDCLCDMDDELANLAESKLTDSKDAYVNDERKIFDSYLEKIKAIKSISLISNDEVVEARQNNESRANFRKREQEVAHANLLKREVDGCLIDLDVELTKLIESKLSSDSRAKFEKRSNEIVDVALAKLEQLHTTKSRAEVYLSAINVELAKKEKSELVVHLSRTKRHKETYIYISSLSTWAKEKYNISMFAEIEPSISKNRETVVYLPIPPSDIKPWDIPHPNDLKLKKGEKWYPAARYLARKYLADHPGLSITKQKLAVKVAELMTIEKIVHSGNTPYSDRTVRKAFRYVTF